MCFEFTLRERLLILWNILYPQHDNDSKEKSLTHNEIKRRLSSKKSFKCDTCNQTFKLFKSFSGHVEKHKLYEKRKK